MAIKLWNGAVLWHKAVLHGGAGEKRVEELIAAQMVERRIDETSD